MFGCEVVRLPSEAVAVEGGWCPHPRPTPPRVVRARAGPHWLGFGPRWVKVAPAFGQKTGCFLLRRRSGRGEGQSGSRRCGSCGHGGRRAHVVVGVERPSSTAMVEVDLATLSMFSQSKCAKIFFDPGYPFVPSWRQPVSRKDSRGLVGSGCACNSMVNLSSFAHANIIHLRPKLAQVGRYNDSNPLLSIFPKSPKGFHPAVGEVRATAWSPGQVAGRLMVRPACSRASLMIPRSVVVSAVTKAWSGTTVPAACLTLSNGAQDIGQSQKLPCLLTQQGELSLKCLRRGFDDPAQAEPLVEGAGGPSHCQRRR